MRRIWKDATWLVTLLAVIATAAFGWHSGSRRAPAPLTTSLSIHGIELGMSRTSIENMLGKPILEYKEYHLVEYHNPDKPAPAEEDAISVGYDAGHFAETIGGDCVELRHQKVGTQGQHVPRLIEELQSKQAYSGTAGDPSLPTHGWRLDDLDLTVLCYDLEGSTGYSDKVKTFILERCSRVEKD